MRTIQALEQGFIANELPPTLNLSFGLSQFRLTIP
jgi:hypothetical protein